MGRLQPTTLQWPGELPAVLRQPDVLPRAREHRGTDRRYDRHQHSGLVPGGRAGGRPAGTAQTFTKYALALPLVLPLVIVVDIWAYMLAPTDGVIDTSLNALGIPSVQWLSNPSLALISILLIGFPWVSSLSYLIFLGGIQRIPDEFREAASLDGANRLRQMLKIDIPLVRPQYRVVVIISGIYAVQNFIPILILTNGGPGNSTMVPGLDMYQSAFTNDQYGYGMAIGSLMFVGIVLITIIATRALRAKT